MAATIHEHVSSRAETVSFTGPDAEIALVSMGSSDPTEIKAALLQYISDNTLETYNELQYHHCKMAPMAGALDIWSLKLQYGKSTNTFQMTIDLGGEKAKRNFSKRTVRSYNVIDLLTSLEDEGPDFQKAINVTADKIEGVDAWAKSCKLSIEWSAEFATLDANYVDMLEREFFPSSNESPVMISWATETDYPQHLFYDVGELILHTGSIKRIAEKGVSFSCKFEVIRGELDIEIGERTRENGYGGNPYPWNATTIYKRPNVVSSGGLFYVYINNTPSANQVPPNGTYWSVIGVSSLGDLIQKRGCDYIWARCVKRRNETLGITHDVAASVNVEELYDLRDFGRLGLFDLIEEGGD
jgi:hypothetical protein